MSLTPTPAPSSSPPPLDVNLRDLVRSSFNRDTHAGVHLFSTDAPENLWDLFVSTLTPEIQQTYNCRACSRFAAQYGGLVVIDGDGIQRSAFWRPFTWIPEEFRPAFDRVCGIVERSSVTGAFWGAGPIWGLPENFGAKHQRTWEHISLETTDPAHYAPSEHAANVKMGEARTNHEVLARSLGELKANPDAVKTAIDLLLSGKLNRPEKALPQAEWLLALQTKLAGEKNQRVRNNLLWKAAAEAPVGWCHVRSGMLGTLLEDVIESRTFHVIKARWDEKMDPLAYRRTQAPASAGNVLQAEKLVAEMGIAESLKRRFARKEDVAVRLWEPTTPEKAAVAGVFGHLLKKSEPAARDLGSTAITWKKFLATVLPRAQKIEFWVPPTLGFYGALVTAANPEAPPILQWDYPDARNPVSNYQYAQGPRLHGSYPGTWGLKANQYVNVWAITPSPTRWNPSRVPANNPESVYLLLEGAKDQNVIAGNAGGGFFTESLKAELYPIRSTLEHYAANAIIEGAAEAGACGVAIHDGAKPVQVRVTTGTVRANYNIDRWE